MKKKFPSFSTNCANCGTILVEGGSIFEDLAVPTDGGPIVTNSIRSIKRKLFIIHFYKRIADA